MDFSSIIEGLKLNNIDYTDSTETVISSTSTTNNLTVFDVSEFIKELRINSQKNNKNFHNNSERFNAYDIAHNCIRSVLFRVNKYPIQDYSDSWLPVKLRTNLGTACHEFIQKSKVFTETETYLRVPSQNMSVKIDCLINTNVLVEIKSCNYMDYDQIIKKNIPRNKDIYQAVLYKYLLENYLDESLSQELTADELKKYSIPKHRKYNIETLQFIYICHELVSAEAESIEQDIEFSKRLKKFLNSKNNKFWFIKSIELNTKNFDMANIEKYVVNKISELNKFNNMKQIPPMNNQFVDSKACFFCLFKQVCSNHG